ncbi:MAG: cytochrome c biogenesis protein ResB [Deltaproteobacteria bacterium]|nr:cytochrome c biogenesis protein ResB [Deltaproteobacteria bacterium]
MKNSSSMWQLFCRAKAVQFLASLKLAVVLILSFALAMAWGTIEESTHNATYAQWKIYLSPAFIALEILLCLNILFAALVRFPFKKRLIGFYIIHLGLLTLFAGAAATAIWGIDGNLRLVPEKPSNAVVINEPTFYLYFYNKPNRPPIEFIEPLPRKHKEFNQKNTPFVEALDYDVFLERFLPFSKAKASWVPLEQAEQSSRVLNISLKNQNFGENITLSSFDLKGMKKQLGPLTTLLLPKMNSSCFLKAVQNPTARYVFQSGHTCLELPEITEKGLVKNSWEFSKEKNNHFDRISVKAKDASPTLDFFPNLSVFPSQNAAQIDLNANQNLVDLQSIRGKPHLIFFRDDQLVFGKSEWQSQELVVNAEQNLPWMGLSATVTQIIDNKKQKLDWFESLPSPQGEQTHFSALVRIQNRYNPKDTQSLWIDDTQVHHITTAKGTRLELMVGNKLHLLPFEFSLDQFKMATNPGTQDPASYESFVTTNTLGKKESAHIYMNNPLKKGGFTFYQASYFQTDDGQFGSVLSVNKDPGRVTKYIGSLLIVLGSAIHFTIIPKLKKKRAMPQNMGNATKTAA